MQTLCNAQRLLWRPPWLSVSKERGARELKVGEILAESEML